MKLRSAEATRVKISDVRQRGALGVLVAIAVAGLPGSVLAQGDASAAATFARDVAPIMQENCQICHRPGSIGPMSFMSYEEVRPWAPVIRQQVLAREMPPYHYDTDVGIQALQYDARLSDDEIRTIVAWVDAGAPLGDLAHMPPPATFPEPGVWQLSSHFNRPPDIVVPSEPFTVPAAGGDLWFEPIVRIPVGDQNRYIQGIEVKPSVEGNQVVHHANTTLLLPNPETGELDRAGVSRFTEHAIGKLGELVPSGAGRVLPTGAHVQWSIHYYPSGEEIVDEVTELGFWLHPEDYEPLYEQTLQNYRLDGDLVIPPHSTAMTQGFHSWDHPVRIDSFQPHGHLRLRAKMIEIYHPHSGERELVSMISNWHPGWHLSHLYEEQEAPLLPAGSVMILTAWYDNTTNNPHNPDPDAWVDRADRTGDEMSHAWIAVTHLDQEGYERLVAEREARMRVAGLDND